MTKIKLFSCAIIVLFQGSFPVMAQLNDYITGKNSLTVFMPDIGADSILFKTQKKIYSITEYFETKNSRKKCDIYRRAFFTNEGSIIKSEFFGDFATIATFKYDNSNRLVEVLELRSTKNDYPNSQAVFDTFKNVFYYGESNICEVHRFRNSQLITKSSIVQDVDSCYYYETIKLDTSGNPVFLWKKYICLDSAGFIKEIVEYNENNVVERKFSINRNCICPLSWIDTLYNYSFNELASIEVRSFSNGVMCTSNKTFYQDNMPVIRYFYFYSTSERGFKKTEESVSYRFSLKPNTKSEFFIESSKKVYEHRKLIMDASNYVDKNPFNKEQRKVEKWYKYGREGLLKSEIEISATLKPKRLLKYEFFK